MKNELHVVLGAAGVIGQAVISELKTRNLTVRAVERRKSVEGTETVHADLLFLNQALQAIKDATHVYLCIGVPFKSKLWLEQWPQIMNNVIKACETTKARLIFLDNVYMYGPSPLKVPFTESHTQNPSSQKGKVRKKIADMLMEAHRSGRIKAVIGRSADFYGPHVVNSPLYIAFLERMLMGKDPQSLGRLDVPHTYAYTLDNGKALVALALDEKTYGQVWHLPVSEAVTVEEAVLIYNKVMGKSYKASMIPRFILSAMSVFNPAMRELKEMLYQIDYPYIMDDRKFKNYFTDFKVTSIEDGIRAQIESFNHKH